MAGQESELNGVVPVLIKQSILEGPLFMIWYLSLAPKPMHPMLPRPFSTGDQHERQFHPRQGVRSVCISD
jgi:hypothetical protein